MKFLCMILSCTPYRCPASTRLTSPSRNHLSAPFVSGILIPHVNSVWIYRKVLFTGYLTLLEVPTSEAPMALFSWLTFPRISSTIPSSLRLLTQGHTFHSTLGIFSDCLIRPKLRQHSD